MLCGRPAFIQYWVWTQVVDRASGVVLRDWQQQLSPRTLCLGPRNAGVPRAAAIAGLLATDFQSLVVLKGLANAQPAGRTLVNFDTGFFTDAVAYDLPPLVLLGAKVRVRAHALRYDWAFGDGSELPDGGPGHKGTTDVSHRYVSTGPVGPSVTITWTGTYTVDGGPQQAVFGTARTVGPATPLQVKEARAERVSQ